MHWGDNIVMVVRIRNINPVQLAVVAGLVACALGVIEAVMVLVTGAAIADRVGGMFSFFPYLGVASILALPIANGVTWFVIGLVGGVLYNWIAGFTGGIEATFVTVQTTAAPEL